MKQKLTETDLRNVVYERIKKILSESFGVSDDNSESSFILQPKYTNFIKTACHVLAWKGLDFNLNIKGPEYRTAKQLIDSYLSAKQEAIKSSNPKENVAKVKETWRNKRGCEGLVDSEKEAFELFSQFKNEGYEFISKYLGNKNNASKQMEKSAGLALFGKESDLPEFNIMHGAVFCVRDFFKWVNAGKPDFERTSDGKLKRGDGPLKDSDIDGGIVNKDELMSAKKNEPELWRDVKSLLDNRRISPISIAKVLIGGNAKGGQEDLKELMSYISEYRTLITGSKQNKDAFRTNAYDTLDKLVDKIKEMGAESAVKGLLSMSQSSEINEGRLPDMSALHNEEKAELLENTRKIKILLAKSYDLADQINDFRFKKLFGKMLEVLLKAERDQERVALMKRNGLLPDDD